MRSGSRPIRLFGLLLVLALLGAQLHLCADFATANSGSHLCQICATAGHAVIAQSLVADHTPAVCRMESSCPSDEVSTLVFTITSPRAPPSL
jgi:hypothetical protein